MTGVRLLVFGASGGTGRLVVEGALAAGHRVTAVARHLGDLPAHPGLTLRPADVRQARDLAEIASAHDAAISALGGRARHPAGIYSGGTRAVTEALRTAGVSRLIAVSSGGVRSDDPGLPLWYRLAIPVFLRELYRDMSVMEDIVRNSSLDWTLVRSAYLTDGRARGTYRVQDSRNPPGGWRLSRADLAAFLLQQLTDTRWLGRTPTLAY
ncbi:MULTISPECIES: NAD(P)H-binding protein [unclassified Micromonospora]|uniref:NAD(P)-dependent oxidoreductase n=1 Tax=unclassified Micromonospora TaxID=2617518 RepID=UPI001C21822A|nr:MULTISPECIES: NAD(P)H-binding protein [unclassified Micromonospora]MBU8855842.1 NAD(P)H-binding protein [Micromonospora sp. WMMB482]MDG4800040.1 NAD(P)H-binding protein [Micromonospora sp. WMMD980]MDM4781444.1 NAD(P)H-binding protein [Micromonospora sp. b486]